MTPGQTIELAKQAGFKQRLNCPNEWWMMTDDIQRFVELVRNQTLDEVANACQNWGNPSSIVYLGSACRAAASRITGMKS